MRPSRSALLALIVLATSSSPRFSFYEVDGFVIPVGFSSGRGVSGGVCHGVGSVGNQRPPPFQPAAASCPSCAAASTSSFHSAATTVGLAAARDAAAAAAVVVSAADSPASSIHSAGTRDGGGRRRSGSAGAKQRQQRQRQQQPSSRRRKRRAVTKTGGDGTTDGDDVDGGDAAAANGSKRRQRRTSNNDASRVALAARTTTNGDDDDDDKLGGGKRKKSAWRGRGAVNGGGRGGGGGGRGAQQQQRGQGQQGQGQQRPMKRAAAAVRRPKNTRARSIARGRDPLLSLNMNLDAIAKSALSSSSSSASASSTASPARSNLEAARRAEQLLLRIENLHGEGYYESPPDVVSYNSVMNAYAAGVGGLKGAEEAERVFRRLLELSREDRDNLGGRDRTVGSRRPNVVSFNTVILAYANSGQAERAESLLNEMEELCSVEPPATSSSSSMGLSCPNASTDGVSGDTESPPSSFDCRPNTITYNECIHAWATAKNPHRAEALLRRMMAASHASTDERNASTSSAASNEEDRDVKPDTIAFNAVLHAYASSSGGIEYALRAESLLKHMEALHDAGNDDVKPDVVSYTSVLSAWASSGDADAPDKAREWLEYMNELYETTGEESVRPNVVSYTCAINALGRSGAAGGLEGAAAAHDLLSKMETLSESGERPDLTPDVACYSSVIDAYARAASGTSYRKGGGGGGGGGRRAMSFEQERKEREMAANNAEMLLDHMNDLYRRAPSRGNSGGGGDGDPLAVRPNVRTYCSVLTALGRSGAYGAAERAEALLDDMERQYAFGENDSVKPNAVAYNAVIDAYARSGLRDKAERARDVLDRMRERSTGRSEDDEEGSGGDEECAPDVITYNSVLYAASSSYTKLDPVDKRRAFRVALDAFKSAGGSGSPASSSSAGANGSPDESRNRQRRPLRRTPVTYTLFLKSVRRLVPPSPERDAMVRRTFEHCLNEGLVNDKVLDQLRFACQKAQCRGGGDVDEGTTKTAVGGEEEKAGCITFEEVLRSCGYATVKNKEGPDDVAAATKGGGTAVNSAEGEQVDWRDLPEEWRRNANRRR